MSKPRACLMEWRLSVAAGSFRPKLNIKCADRQYKLNGYTYANTLAIKYDIVPGSYFGLAAAHPDQIMAVLGNHLTGVMDSCENDPKLIEQLKTFYGRLNTLSKELDQEYETNMNNQFNLSPEDIFQFLKYSERKYSIGDFDFPGNLSDQKINQITEVLPGRLSKRSMILLWNMYGRGTSLKGHYCLLDKLHKMLKNIFKIVYMEDRYEYVDKSPMCMQPIILEE